MSTIFENTGILMDEAEAMLGSASASAAKRYDQAQKAVDGILERGKDIYGSARKQAIRQAKAADEMLHGHLYNTVLIGIGLGVILGYLAAKNLGRRSDE